jgi:hypothetical protein
VCVWGESEGAVRCLLCVECVGSGGGGGAGREGGTCVLVLVVVIEAGFGTCMGGVHWMDFLCLSLSLFTLQPPVLMCCQRWRVSEEQAPAEAP